MALLTMWGAACSGSDNGTTEAGGTEGTSRSTDGTTTPGTPGAGGTLTVYSGRSEELVGPLFEKFEQATGIELEVRYGDTAEMAAQILEEGDNSPADVYFGQDAGALGALSAAGVLAPLDQATLDAVPAEVRSPKGEWVGVSGRARVVVYNTEALSAQDLPASIVDYTDPEWKGKIGWAPTNGSFQSFVTALRVTEGEEAAKAWLEGIQANEPVVYEKNGAIVEAVANGEVEVGFVNHYYLLNMQKESPDLAAANFYFTDGDIGGLLNVAGVGILRSTEKEAAAKAFVEFLLSDEAQEYFATETSEIPLVTGIDPPTGIPVAEVRFAPDVDLDRLEDLEGTLALLQETGVL